MTALTVGTKTYSDVTGLISQFPELLVHYDQLATVITSADPAPANLQNLEDLLLWLYGHPAAGVPEEIYVNRMLQLTERLKRQPLAKLASLQDADLPELFHEILSVRIGMLKAVDDYVRTLTAGLKTTEKFRAPARVGAGLLLAEEAFTQLTNIIRRYTAGKKPPEEMPAPVLGTSETAEATRLWHAYAGGRVMVFRNVQAAIGEAKGVSDKARRAMADLGVPTPPHVADLMTRIAILLHFTPTRAALAAVEAAVREKGRLIIIGGSKETLATLPSDAAAEADPFWKGEGWHTGLIIGQEREVTKLLPAGRFTRTESGGTALVPDIDEARWNGYTLATREIILAHELDHIRRQVGGGWSVGGFPADGPPSCKSAFQKGEEYRAVADGEQPLRALLGLQPRGHVSTSVEIVLNVEKAAVDVLEKTLIDPRGK